MSRLFLRSYKLTVDTIEISNDDGQGLDIAFKVTKSIKGEPNKAEIKIYNLNPDHRGELQKRFGSQIENKKRKPIRVELEAGYKDDRGVIFRGDLRNLVTKKEGLDFVTTISGSDGGHGYKTGRIAKSYGAQTPVATVARDCAQAMGIGEGNLGDFLGAMTLGGVGKAYAPGTVIHGCAADAFDRMMKTAGVTWTIHNGVLQLQKKGEPLQRKAFQISPQSGLIGAPAPEIDATFIPNASGKVPSKPSKTGLLLIKTLLIHHLYPGVVIDLKSDEFNGGRQLTECEYVGDSSAGAQDWYINHKARPY